MWENTCVAPYLPHQDLSPTDKHRWTVDVEALLEPLQVELLHFLVTALHLYRMESEDGQLLHVLWRQQR